MTGVQAVRRADGQADKKGGQGRTSKPGCGPFRPTPVWPRNPLNPRKTLPTAPTLVVSLPPTPLSGVRPQQSSINQSLGWSGEPNKKGGEGVRGFRGFRG